MKICLFILFFSLPVYISAQATRFIIESFQLDLNDLEANRNPVFDANDKKCALIKVRTDLSDIKFSSNNGIVKQNKVFTEYWIYVSYDEKKLNIYKDGFLPLNFDIPLTLEESKVYTFYITANKRYSVIIQTEPKNAQVWFNNQLIQEPNIKNITTGKYPLKILHDGYLPVNDTITVDEEHIFFSYIMEKTEPILVTITSEPTGSALIINNNYKGLTPRQLFLYPGKYDIQLSKEFHKEIKEKITVNNNEANNFFYKLKLNISYIQVFTFPQDAEVFCDGKRMLEKTKIEGGEHIIETKSDLFYTDKRIINVTAGIDTTIQISLHAKMGKLQFTVNPLNAKGKLFRGETLLKSWTGAKRIENLQIGQYTLVVDAKKYRKVKKQIEIKENVTEKLFVDLALEKQSGRKGKLTAVALSTVIPGLGQYYSGYNFRSIIYLLTGIGAGALAVHYNSEFNKILEKYNNSKIVYNNSVILTDIYKSHKEMYDYYNQLNILNNNRQLFFISYASIYGINVIDAIIFGKKNEKKAIEGEKSSGYFNIHPAPFYGGLGLQIRYTF